MRLGFAIAVVAATASTALATEPAKYVPTGPLTTASMKGVSNFYEWNLRWVAFDRQIKMGLDGSASEVCANQLFVRYQKPDTSAEWPFNVDWQDVKGWKDLTDFNTEVNKRSKLDELKLRLCLNDAAASKSASSAEGMTDEEWNEIIDEDIVSDGERIAQLAEDLGIGREFIAYCTANFLKMRNEAQAAGIHSRIPLGQTASEIRDPDQLRAFVREIRDYGWSYYQLCMRDVARQMAD